jgi:hypothetical protein
MNLRICFRRLRNAAAFCGAAWRSYPPRLLINAVGCFSAERLRRRRRLFGANGCRGRANPSTHSVSYGNLYVRRNVGDRYVDLVFIC